MTGFALFAAVAFAVQGSGGPACCRHARAPARHAVRQQLSHTSPRAYHQRIQADRRSARARTERFRHERLRADRRHAYRIHVMRIHEARLHEARIHALRLRAERRHRLARRPRAPRGCAAPI